MQSDERAEGPDRAGAGGEGPYARGPGSAGVPRRGETGADDPVSGRGPGLGAPPEGGPGPGGVGDQRSSGEICEPESSPGSGSHATVAGGAGPAGVAIPAPRPAALAPHSAPSGPRLAGDGSGTNHGRLSLPGQIVLGVAIAVVAVAVAVHLTMSFLHVAPSNTVSREHSETIGDYIYPEFEQNWKLFAPNPLQQNVAVQARAEVRTPDGGTAVTSWTNLTAEDGAAIRHNPLPSHSQQNQLRRAWEYYASSHDAKEQPVGLRGQLSEQYVRRMVAQRFGPKRDGGTVERIQVRAATKPVAPPSWSEEKIDLKTVYRVLPWWPVTSHDLPGQQGPDDRAGGGERVEDGRPEGSGR